MLETISIQVFNIGKHLEFVFLKIDHNPLGIY
jgi:hypothetical protein